MSGASIAFDQARPSGPSYGTPSVARNDLWEGRVITCRSTESGPTSWFWELLDVPPGSAAALATPTTANATFTPDVPGSYRVRLTVNGGGPGNVQVLIAGVRYNSSGVLVNRGWQSPAFGEVAGDDNTAGNVRGYAPKFEYILADLLTFISGGGSGGPGNATFLTADGTGTTPANYQAIVAGAGISTTPNAGAHTFTIALGTVPLTNIASGTGYLHGTGSAPSYVSTLALSDLANAGGANGDVMYWNGSNWTRLAVGSSGNVLTVSGGVPAWQAASGGASYTTYYWNPSGSSSGNTSTTFAGIYSAVSAVAGDIDVLINGTTSPTIDAGTYLFANRFTLRSGWVGGDPATINVDSGTILTDLSKLDTVALTFLDSGSFAISSGNQLSIELNNASLASDGTAANHAIDITTGSHDIFLRGPQSYLLTSGSFAVIHLHSGATLNVYLREGAVLNADAVQGPVGSTLNIFCDSPTQIQGVLSGTFLGTIAISVTSGIVNNFFWKSGSASNGSDQFGAFSQLYGVASNVSGTIDVFVNGASTPSFVSGTYALDGRYIFRGNFVTGTPPLVTVGSGATLTNLTQLKNIGFLFTLTSQIAISGSYPLALDLENAVLESNSNAANHAIDLASGTHHSVILRGALSSLATLSASYGVIHAQSGVTVNVYLRDGATLNADAVRGAAGSTLNVYYDSAAQIVGTLSTTFLGTIYLHPTNPIIGSGVTVSGTPSAGQVLQASSSTAAGWATPSAGTSGVPARYAPDSNDELIYYPNAATGTGIANSGSAGSGTGLDLVGHGNYVFGAYGAYGYVITSNDVATATSMSSGTTGTYRPSGVTQATMELIFFVGSYPTDYAEMSGYQKDAGSWVDGFVEHTIRIAAYGSGTSRLNAQFTFTDGTALTVTPVQANLSKVVQPGIWHHAQADVFQLSSVQYQLNLYLDGTLIGSGVATVLSGSTLRFSTTGQWFLLNAQDGGGYPGDHFDGSVQEFRFAPGVTRGRTHAIAVTAALRGIPPWT